MSRAGSFSNSNNGWYPNKHSSPVSNRSGSAKKKNNYNNAVNHWYGKNAYYRNSNEPLYYKFIRNSPVVEFKTNANVIRMLKQFGLGGTNSNYYKGRNTYQGAIFRQVPKHRKLYIMNVKPFRLAYGEKGINKIPGMVKAWNQHSRNLGQLALVNKALMNRYLHQRSLEALAKQKYTLANAKKLVKVTNILNKNIQRKRQVVRNAAEKWRFQASMQAGKKRFMSHLAK